MTEEFDLIALGRACIDLNAVDYNQPMEDTLTFKKYVGGSPANVVIGSAKLGAKVGFIGKVPDDQHGRFIASYLKQLEIDTSQLSIDRQGHKAGLAFTEIKSPEECSILMYRDEVADLYLTPEDISETYLKTAKMLLISGTALAKSPSREAVLKAVMLAQKNKVQIVFELDYRPYTWQSPEEVALYYTLVAEKADNVIGTREEYDQLAGQKTTNEATIQHLFAYRPELIVIKHGVDGSFAYTKTGKRYQAKAYPSKVLKTFGAGDSYAAAFLHALRTEKDVELALKYGSAAAAIVVSKHSSSEAMPTISEIESIIYS